MPTTSRTAATSRSAVDASMQLLREVMEQPVDPGYAEAARRRAAGGRPRRVTMMTTIALALVCGWLATRGVTELRRPEPGQVASRAALEREIDRRTAAADAQQQVIERLRNEITAAQRNQLTSPQDAALASRVQQLALTTGELPVVGPGLQITLRDAKPKDTAGAAVDPRGTSDSEEGRVLDRDMQVVVNGLWVSGAEAVAINGRRLTALSAIRSAGQAILVDFRPLVPPYVVQAVGDPSALQSRFTADMAGAYVQTLRDNFGIGVDIAASSQLRLPAAGTFELRSATPVAADGGASRGASATPSVSRSAVPSSMSSSPEVAP